MSTVASALADAGRAAVGFDRGKVHLDAGFRTAVGIAIPLAAGELSGHTVAGVTASIGALTAGMSSLQGTYRSRAAVVFAASLVMAASAFVGATVGHLLGVDIVVTGLLGFAAGLLVCLGQSALVVGVQAIVGLVVFSQFTFGAVVALRDAGLVLAGGVIQMILIVLVWPLRRFRSEREALGLALTTLADYCRSIPSATSSLLDPVRFERLAEVLRDPQPFGGDEIAAYLALGGQVERIRLELVALGRARSRLLDAARQNTPDAGTVPGSAVLALDQLLVASARVLDEVASALTEGRAPTRWEDERDRFEQSRSTIRQAGDRASTAWLRATLADLSRHADALAGQMRTVVRLAAVPVGADPAELERAALTGARLSGRRTSQAPRAWIGERVATLRSNLALSSQAFRHALRLAVTLGLAVALSHAFALQHRYWLPMTAMIVLRPDFGSTFSRGISRVVGTLVGAGLVTVILAEWRPSAPWLSVLVVLLCFAATSLLQANYAIYSVCIASLVVTLLAFTGEPEVSTAGDRSIYTVIGAALALIVYAVWPTWESTSLPETLAGLLETEGQYARMVLEAWSDPGTADRQALERARIGARLARSNAEAAVSRWMSEPRHGDILKTDDVLALMAAVRTCVQGIIALHAELPTEGEPRPLIRPLAEGIGSALESVASAIRGGQRVPARLPALRADHGRLAESLGLGLPDPTASIDERAVALAGETDLVVNSVNTLGQLVGLSPG